MLIRAIEGFIEPKQTIYLSAGNSDLLREATTHTANERGFVRLDVPVPTSGTGTYAIRFASGDIHEFSLGFGDGTIVALNNVLALDPLLSLYQQAQFVDDSTQKAWSVLPQAQLVDVDVPMWRYTTNPYLNTSFVVGATTTGSNHDSAGHAELISLFAQMLAGFEQKQNQQTQQEQQTLIALQSLASQIATLKQSIQALAARPAVVPPPSPPVPPTAHRASMRSVMSGGILKLPIEGGNIASKTITIDHLSPSVWNEILTLIRNNA